MADRAKLLSVAIAGGTLLGAVTVSTAPAAVGSPQGSITVVLRAPHPAALTRLARATRLSHTQRMARLARLVPSGVTVHRVSAALAAEGLNVTDATAWTLTASGSMAALPALSAALSPYAAAVFPTNGPKLFHHSAAIPLNGKDFRNAYTSKRSRPRGAGRNADGKATIATLQLAGFSSSDLTTYAKKEHLPKIVGTPRYHPVMVRGGAGSAANSGGGDVEVALDQESILSTAPSARQRPYFAPNTNAGFIGVFANVFDDVVQNKHRNGKGDPHITALSSSWGGCEENYGAARIRATQTVIKALVAAGVTVFAASGDDGIYDCRDSTGTGLGNSRAGVDFPASSPQVVGVGGTNLQHAGNKGRRNNGHNWHEKAWSCASTTTCEGNGLLPVLPQGTGGTGGGESGLSGGPLSSSPFKGFPEPAYQRRGIHGKRFGHQKHRLVPDIAAVGDPQTGFKLFCSDSSLNGFQDSHGLVTVGGTSLSSPVSAALFTNMLAAAGRQTGVGDIHPALYAAYRKGQGVFRDVTAGTNGANSQRGRDPSVAAGRGYDTVSGLGAVLWPALAPYLHLHLR